MSKFQGLPQLPRPRPLPLHEDVLHLFKVVALHVQLALRAEGNKARWGLVGDVVVVVVLICDPVNLLKDLHVVRAEDDSVFPGRGSHIA